MKQNTQATINELIAGSNGPMDILKQTLRKEGFFALYKEIALAGAMAGVANASLPVQMFKVRMQGQYGAATDKRLSAVVAEMWRDWGFRKGIMRGYWVTVAREIPAYAGSRTPIQYIAHELKTIVQEAGIAPRSHRFLLQYTRAASTFAAFELTRQYLETATGV
ncbi:hypothetical protein BJ912DRAFT_1015363, partial [Pholiota molesta]